MTESELLTAYKQTDEIRFVSELYQPYMQMVFTICFKYLKDSQESEDAVMNIFEKLIVDLRTNQVINFKSWLHSVTRNYCLMELRVRPVFVFSDKMEEPTDLVEFMDDFDLTNLDTKLDKLERCMKTLTAEQKASIDLFFLQEKCYREISDQTGFDFNKVKSYIQNGKRNLKICMENNGGR
ncbi:sigma-70 family RNA polymerase sigma factor [Dyadobacter psychrotolerans]|uniref:Sigma-70 family RNA polymerase sigma factor n=1 Tax=Dyadobacter psychrotolerans TaxID=2541721 RepID=A0A4V2Z2V8_9BACT|nr:sigma-70 family RNA polymerase sigma factor [Dyadobacter psychrotolerans]